MKLLTKEILKKLPALYSQEKTPDPIVQVKFFLTFSNWTWYGLEYDPVEGRFFGLVQGHEEELGYFTLDELLSVRNVVGLGVERDKFFDPCPLSQVQQKEQGVYHGL